VLAHAVAPYPHARVEPVDYSEAAVARVAERFFDGSFVPPKDFRGGPFYTYFYGLLAARHERVLHVDCDMMFGGGSQHWIAEACKILDTRADVLACSPLPGPPTERGRLRTQDALPEPVVPDAFRFDKLSTRLFLLDRRALAALGPFPLSWPVRLPDKLRALARGGPRYALPEDLVTRAMRRANLVRLDFLGTAPGMWSVHPATRDERFYACLPRLIARIERGDVSDDQRGAYDLSPGMLEW
jgi:hypothetical protein